MINVLTWLIKKPIENSQLLEHGYPKGAVALAATGVCIKAIFITSRG
jgi:hypothetical protein